MPKFRCSEEEVGGTHQGFVWQGEHLASTVSSKPENVCKKAAVSLFRMIQLGRHNLKHLILGEYTVIVV